ncbi:MAG: hypothetical protein ACR2H5_06020, partial [Ktedonobacteraceae bacterium]
SAVQGYHWTWRVSFSQQDNLLKTSILFSFSFGNPLLDLVGVGALAVALEMDAVALIVPIAS